MLFAHGRVGAWDMRLRIWLGVAAAVVANSAASAAVVISADRGGPIDQYRQRYAMIRQSGEQVIIAGRCLSACTLVLALVPRDRICVTANARLGFHAAWFPDMAGGRILSAAHTRRLHELYPPAIRHWIARRGGLSSAMIFLQGRELQAFLPLCQWTASKRPGRAVAANRHSAEISIFPNGLANGL